MVIDFDGKTYDFDMTDIDVRQATLIKIKTGYNLKQWEQAIREADVDAFRGLYWLMLAQNGIAVDIDKVNFKILKYIEAFANASKAESESAEGEPVTVSPTPRKRTTG